MKIGHRPVIHTRMSSLSLVSVIFNVCPPCVAPQTTERDTVLVKHQKNFRQTPKIKN